MIKYLRRFYFQISIAIAMATLLVMFFSHSRKEYEYVFGNFFQNISQPVVLAAITTSDWFAALYQQYNSLTETLEKNAQLQSEVNRLKAEILQYQENLVDLPKYQKAFRFLEETQDEKIYALVVAELKTEYSHILLINRGTKDGVKKNQGVVSYNGIVGQIKQVSENRAMVMMITDVQSKVPVILQKSRTRAIVQGDGKGYLLLKLLPREEVLEIGDKVNTSAITSIFPNGYEVGIIQEVYKKEFGWFQEAKLRPTVDLEKIEDVFVLKNSGQKDLFDVITTAPKNN